MNEQDIKKIVENLIMEMVGQENNNNSNQTLNNNNQNNAVADNGCIDDITKIDLRKQLLVENPADKEGYLELKSKTSARLGIGRAGARYKTITALRVRADHAAAQDSVFSDVSEDFIKRNNFVFVKTMCKDKDEYLTRPDLGRKFGPEEETLIKQTFSNKPKVILAVGDGLSSAAIEANAEDIIPAIKQGLQTYGINIDKVLFIKYARVGAQDVIGQITDADVVCLLVGERPGLVTAESMSAYITYKPKVGIPEAKRTVISNIHKGGTVAVEAGAHTAELIKTMLDKKASGIDLK